MRVAVIGGGVSGLVAARALRHGGATVDLFESGTLGGSLRGVPLPSLPFGDPAGLPDVTVDVGAEAGLARRPELTRLIGELGLSAVHPDPTQKSQVVAGGALRPIPRGIMGIPSDPAEAERVLGVPLHETPTPPLTEDVSVADFVSSRLGGALVDALVDPLLGGVYASDAHTLSLRATVPALWDAARSGASLLDLAAAIPAPTGTPAPVFVAPRGGMSALVPALRSELEGSGVRIHETRTVAQLLRRGGGWRLVGTDGSHTEVDGVLVATSVAAAGKLLSGVLEHGPALAALPHATSALLTAVIGADEPLSGSGFLVPPKDTRVIKASTFSSRKWPWLGEGLPDGVEVVRMSVGRYGAADQLGLADGDLLEAGLADFRRLTGRSAPLIAGHVQRWTGALPQYLPGHVDFARAVESEIETVLGLAVAGNAFEGVGVPACIARAERAADTLLT